MPEWLPGRWPATRRPQDGGRRSGSPCGESTFRLADGEEEVCGVPRPLRGKSALLSSDLTYKLARLGVRNAELAKLRFMVDRHVGCAVAGAADLGPSRQPPFDALRVVES